MQPFSIKNRLTPGDYTGIILKKTFARPAMIFLMALGILSLIMNLLGLAKIVPPSTLVFFPWVFVIFPFVIPLLAAYKARSIYKASQRLQTGVAYTFAEEGVTAKAPDSEWTYEWNTILKFEETGKFILLYPTTNSAEIIKKELLTAAQIDFIKAKTQADLIATA